MKKLVREFEFSPEQLHTVQELSYRLGLSETVTGILYARGMDTEEKMQKFLHPGAKNFLSPFLLKGMREAVDLITAARDGELRVAVFGDYDADGVGACAVLSRALAMFGIEPYVFVPERADGYGLSVGAIDRIFDEFLPDLVITVDCGISCRKEVEYIKELGADVIVTDHHELPEQLPDCILIDPKLGGDYPYDNLCGAGVAFKLAQALIGERALPLVDFAAISTVADSVPLTGENRDIVAEGLRRIEREPRPAIAALLGKAEVSAQSLAFTIAPRINAAGRMGHAHAALALFTSEDGEEIEQLAALLERYNAERQRACDELYCRVSAQIAKEGPYDNVIMLAGTGWNAGFAGIVAARVAEEYARPALLFTKREGAYKGSARSVENVNIFEALKSCSAYISEFGGHAQAAGINVSEENFEALKGALNAYIGEHYTREDFVPSVAVAGELSGDFRRIARELTMLEPCGMGNKRPLFYLEAERTDAAPMKEGSPHLAMNIRGADFVYFGGVKSLELLKSDLKKKIVFECNLSRFKGREYIKGLVRCVLTDGMSGRDIELDAFGHAVGLLSQAPSSARILDMGAADSLIREKIAACAYGLCAVVQNRASLASFPSLSGLELDIFRPSGAGAANCVLYSPAPDASLEAFREIVCLDFPPALPKTGNAEIFFCTELADMGALKRVSCVRDDLVLTYTALRAAEGRNVGTEYAEAARALGLGIAPEQVIFALAVFCELGLISIGDGTLRIVRGRHADLEQSSVYTTVRRLKEGA